MQLLVGGLDGRRVPRRFRRAIRRAECPETSVQPTLRPVDLLSRAVLWALRESASLFRHARFRDPGPGIVRER